MTTAFRDPVQEARRALREARAKDPLMTERQARAFVSAYRDAVIPEDHARRMYWEHTHPTPDQVAVAKDATPAPTPARRLVQAVAAVPAPPKPKKVMTPALEAQRRRSRNGNQIAAQVAERIRERVRELRMQYPKHTAGMICPIVAREFGVVIKMSAFYQSYWNKKPKGSQNGKDMHDGSDTGAHPPVLPVPALAAGCAGDQQAVLPDGERHRVDPAAQPAPDSGVAEVAGGERRGSEGVYSAVSAEPILQVIDVGDGFVRVRLSMEMRNSALAGFLAGMGEGMRGE